MTTDTRSGWQSRIADFLSSENVRRVRKVLPFQAGGFLPFTGEPGWKGRVSETIQAPLVQAAPALYNLVAEGVDQYTSFDVPTIDQEEYWRAWGAFPQNDVSEQLSGFSISDLREGDPEEEITISRSYEEINKIFTDLGRPVPSMIDDQTQFQYGQEQWLVLDPKTSDRLQQDRQSLVDQGYQRIKSENWKTKRHFLYEYNYGSREIEPGVYGNVKGDPTDSGFMVMKAKGISVDERNEEVDTGYERELWATPTVVTTPEDYVLTKGDLLEIMQTSAGTIAQPQNLPETGLQIAADLVPLLATMKVGGKASNAQIAARVGANLGIMFGNLDRYGVMDRPGGISYAENDFEAAVNAIEFGVAGTMPGTILVGQSDVYLANIARQLKGRSFGKTVFKKTVKDGQDWIKFDPVKDKNLLSEEAISFRQGLMSVEGISEEQADILTNWTLNASQNQKHNPNKYFELISLGSASDADANDALRMSTQMNATNAPHNYLFQIDGLPSNTTDKFSLRHNFEEFLSLADTAESHRLSSAGYREATDTFAIGRIEPDGQYTQNSLLRFLESNDRNARQIGDPNRPGYSLNLPKEELSLLGIVDFVKERRGAEIPRWELVNEINKQKSKVIFLKGGDFFQNAEVTNSFMPGPGIKSGVTLVKVDYGNAPDQSAVKQLMNPFGEPFQQLSPDQMSLDEETLRISAKKIYTIDQGHYAEDLTRWSGALDAEDATELFNMRAREVMTPEGAQSILPVTDRNNIAVSGRWKVISTPEGRDFLVDELQSDPNQILDGSVMGRTKMLDAIDKEQYGIPSMNFKVQGGHYFSLGSANLQNMWVTPNNPTAMSVGSGSPMQNMIDSFSQVKDFAYKNTKIVSIEDFEGKAIGSYGLEEGVENKKIFQVNLLNDLSANETDFVSPVYITVRLEDGKRNIGELPYSAPGVSAPTARERAPILTLEIGGYDDIQRGRVDSNASFDSIVATRRAVANQILEGMQRAKADTSYMAFSEEQILNGETGYRIIRTKSDKVTNFGLESRYDVDDYSVMSGDSMWGWGYESPREAAMAIAGHLKTRSEFQLPPNALYQENWHLPGLRSMMWTAANEGSNDWFVLSKAEHLLNRYGEEALAYGEPRYGEKGQLAKGSKQIIANILKQEYNENITRQDVEALWSTTREIDVGVRINSKENLLKWFQATDGIVPHSDEFINSPVEPSYYQRVARLSDYFEHEGANKTSDAYKFLAGNLEHRQFVLSFTAFNDELTEGFRRASTDDLLTILNSEDFQFRNLTSEKAVALKKDLHLMLGGEAGKSIHSPMEEAASILLQVTTEDLLPNYRMSFRNASLPKAIVPTGKSHHPGIDEGLVLNGGKFDQDGAWIGNTSYPVGDNLELFGVQASMATSDRQLLLDGLAELVLHNEHINRRIDRNIIDEATGITSLIKLDPKETGLTTQVQGARFKNYDLHDAEFRKSIGFKTPPKDITSAGNLSEAVNRSQFRLFQLNGQVPEGGTVLGWTDFSSDGKFYVKFTKAANFGTAAHEIAHIFRRGLSEDDLRIAGEFAMGRDAYNNLTNRNLWSRAAEETFANAFQRYIETEYAPNAQVRNVFQQFKQWVIQLIRSIKGTPAEENLNPRMKELFDDIIKPYTPSTSKIESVVPEKLQPQAKKYYGKPERTVRGVNTEPRLKIFASKTVGRIARDKNINLQDVVVAGYASGRKSVRRNTTKNQTAVRVTQKDLRAYIRGDEPLREIGITASKLEQARLHGWSTYGEYQASGFKRNQDATGRLFQTQEGIDAEDVVQPPVPTLSPLTDVEQKITTDFIDNNMRALAQKPVLKQILARFSPSSIITDPLGKSLVVYDDLIEEGKQKAQIAFTRLSRLGSQSVIFGETVEATGLIADGNLRGFNVNAIRSNPSDPRWASKLNSAQKEWIRVAHTLEEAKVAMMSAEGIDINLLQIEEGGFFAGRKVVGKFMPDGEMMDVGVVGGPSRPGLKVGFEKERIFPNIEDAISEGYRYLDDEETLLLNLTGAYRRVAQKRMVDYITNNVVYTRGTAVPEEAIAYKAFTARRLKAVDTLMTKLQDAKRGGVMSAQTKKSLENILPEVEGMLDDVSKISLQQLVKAGQVAADQPITFVPRKKTIRALFFRLQDIEDEIKILNDSGQNVPSSLTKELGDLKKKMGFYKFAMGQAYETWQATGNFEYTFSRSATSILVEDKIGAIDQLLEVTRGKPYKVKFGDKEVTRYRGGLISDLKAEHAEALEEFNTISKKLEKTDLTEGNLAGSIPAFSGKIFTTDQPTNLGKINGRDMTGADVENAISSWIVKDRQFSEFLQKVNTVNAASRFFMLAGDASLFTIQLFFLLGQTVRRPTMFPKIMKGFVNGFLDPTFHQDYIYKNTELLNRNPSVLTSIQGTEFTEFARQLSRAGFVRSRPVKLARDIAAEIPGATTAGRGYLGFFRGSQRAFESAMDIAGIELLKMYEHAPEFADPIKRQELGEFINEIRGLSNPARMGVTTQQRQLETLFLLAPRYNRAIVALIADLGRGGVRGTRAREAMGSGLAAITAISIAISIAQGEDVDEMVEHFDPRSDRFFTWTVGGTNIGFGTKVRSIVKLAASIVTTAQGDEPVDLFTMSMDNPIVRFARGNMSPVIGDLTSIMNGRSYLGDPIFGNGITDIPGHIKNLSSEVLLPKFMPIWAQGSILERGSVQQRGTRGLVEFFGGRAYPEGSWHIMNDFAKQTVGMDYSDLEPFERKLLRGLLKDRLDPLLLERVERGDKDAQYWMQLQILDMERYEDEVKLLQGYYNPRANPEFLINGASVLKAEFNKIQSNYSLNRDALNKTFGKYQDDTEYDKDNPEQHVLSEWYSMYNDAVNPRSGVFDASRLEGLEIAFWKKKTEEGKSYSDYYDYIIRNTSNTTHPKQYFNLMGRNTVGRWERSDKARKDFLSNRGNWSSVLDKEAISR